MSTDNEDRHPEWFDELRRVNALLMDCGVADHHSGTKKKLEEQAASLQELMIETGAKTKEELIYQLELLQVMLWDSRHQRLATAIKSAVKNLLPGGS